MSNTFQTSLLPPEAQTNLKAVEDRLKDYVAKMSPGQPITNVEGSLQQKQLWQGVILFLLKQPAPVFLQGWAMFLQVVLDNRKGAFSPMYVNRFREELKLPIDDRRNFERLIHLAYTTCEPKARPLSMRQIDMGQILAMLPSEEMRQKIIAYYQL